MMHCGFLYEFNELISCACKNRKTETQCMIKRENVMETYAIGKGHSSTHRMLQVGIVDVNW